MGEFLQRFCYYVQSEKVVVFPLYIKKIEIFIPCRCLEIFPRTNTSKALKNFKTSGNVQTPRFSHEP